MVKPDLLLNTTEGKATNLFHLVVGVCSTDVCPNVVGLALDGLCEVLDSLVEQVGARQVDDPHVAVGTGQVLVQLNDRGEVKQRVLVSEHKKDVDSKNSKISYSQTHGLNKAT